MKRLFLFLYVLLLFAHPCLAAEKKDITTFATLPILDEGRIKPLDSFARAKIKTFSGRESLSGIGPIEWLIETLFDPTSAAQRPIFKIRNPDLMGMLTLEKKDLYSFSELFPKIMNNRDIIVSILKKPEDEWTQSQHDLILLQQQMGIFEQLMGSLSSILPLAIDIPQDAPDYLKPYAGKIITYRDTLKFRERVDEDLKKIIKTKGENVEKYSPAEQTLALISFTADQLRQKGNTNTLLKIFPAGDGKNWLAPWEILSGSGNPANAELALLWQKLAIADNDEKWNDITQQINEKTSALGQISSAHINTEYSYNLLHPHEASLAFYILSLIIATAALLLNRQKFLTFSGYTLLVGLLIHITSIAARIYILDRPPVSTLYETILFVGAIVVAYGLTLWFKRRDIACLLGAGLGGAVLHTLGFAHSSEGDSLIMLDAVLNTKFWLATHVLCITAGYAFCLVASAFAHFLLFSKYPSPHTQSSMMTATLLSLFFATVGTILGGIWADQSWGRFWGWDPKENGAMLITLWLIWIIHGRISGQMRQHAFQAGVAYLSVIVALSWFGVNLLGVGLHSYGFTDSLALSLGLFVALETALIATLWWRASRAS